ncbi:hypothetical protein C8R44DRAFT_973515 [Mycena epipterygia]|nr:hypothetical protein C8R44DRAFT_973515 [Mycena epipterygia]
MSFLKKWTSSTPQLQVPTLNGKRPLPKALPDGPERGLPILPNELIPTVLTRLDNRSLYRVAQVSRRFNELSTRSWLARHGITPSQLSSGHVVIQSEHPIEAFAAVRTALFLRVHPITDLRCILPDDVDAKTIDQLDALLSWFSLRLSTTELDFGADIIPLAATTKPISRALVKLVSTLASDCSTTVFVLKDGLFTCRPDALRRWNPATGHYEGGWTDSTTTYSSVRMHDGSRQRVPTIHALQTLTVKYPLAPAPAPAPFDKWKLVVVDAAFLTDLQLSIKLAPREWAAILDALALPALVCVGLWAEAISTATSARFFTRHPTIRTLKYMSPTADALPAGCAPLRLPRLESLNTLAPYLEHILSLPSSSPSASCADADSDEKAHADASQQCFPRLSHIELRPHPRLRAALLLASAHAPLTALTLWSLAPAALSPAWPVFPAVRRLALNEVRVMALLEGGLGGLLAHAFPALTHVGVNYSWAGNGGVTAGRQMERERRAFVKEVTAANPGVRTVLFDGREYPMGV